MTPGSTKPKTATRDSRGRANISKSGIPPKTAAVISARTSNAACIEKSARRARLLARHEIQRKHQCQTQHRGRQARGRLRLARPTHEVRPRGRAAVENRIGAEDSRRQRDRRRDIKQRRADGRDREARLSRRLPAGREPASRCSRAASPPSKPVNSKLGIRHSTPGTRHSSISGMMYACASLKLRA